MLAGFLHKICSGTRIARICSAEECLMDVRQRVRDIVFGTLDQELVRRREADGFRLIAVEWERNTTAAPGKADLRDAPFGLRVASDCQHLEWDPDEAEVLRAVMHGVIHDRSLSFIADDLNKRGYRTRGGEMWNPASVFRLMPDLVDNGPRIFSEPEWPARRQSA